MILAMISPIWKEVGHTTDTKQQNKSSINIIIIIEKEDESTSLLLLTPNLSIKVAKNSWEKKILIRFIERLLQYIELPFNHHPWTYGHN
jgi:hypothetical protein